MIQIFISKHISFKLSAKNYKFKVFRAQRASKVVLIYELARPHNIVNTLIQWYSQNSIAHNNLPKIPLRSFKNMGGVEIISNVNKSASWFLPVMKEMHHRCSWCSCGGHSEKHHREGGPRELNQPAPRFQKPGKFQIWFSMPKRLLYPWISSKLFRLNLWPRKATCQPYPSNAQTWNRRNCRNRRERSWGLKMAKIG